MVGVHAGLVWNGLVVTHDHRPACHPRGSAPDELDGRGWPWVWLKPLRPSETAALIRRLARVFELVGNPVQLIYQASNDERWMTTSLRVPRPVSPKEAQPDREPVEQRRATPRSRRRPCFPATSRRVAPEGSDGRLAISAPRAQRPSQRPGRGGQTRRPGRERSVKRSSWPQSRWHVKKGDRGTKPDRRPVVRSATSGWMRRFCAVSTAFHGAASSSRPKRS
ncbi:hypothetical protein SAMN05892883_4241 [Jatrophihabitans sp. GAS493]|nr:hypothetical protein SAMN05892883_4241 [Jatrophihabitans sp. GAS493]